MNVHAQVYGWICKHVRFQPNLREIIGKYLQAALNPCPVIQSLTDFTVQHVADWLYERLTCVFNVDVDRRYPKTPSFLWEAPVDLMSSRENWVSILNARHDA